MRSLRFEDSSAQTFVERDVPQPRAGKGEVVVRIGAAGVTPTELAWYPTTHTKEGTTRVAPVLSHEFSGEIAEIGESVAGFSVGEPVYGMNDWFAEGALAEFCVTRPDWIAAKPQPLSYPEAASVPISALTAWQGLFGRAKLQKGERVLIHGGAGAVGVFAVQLAHWRGAHVISTASAWRAAFVRELGADETIDYKTVAFERRVRGVDVVFDTVGGETLQRSFGVLAPSGRAVTIAAQEESTEDERVKEAFLLVEPRRAELEEIGELLGSGVMRAVVDRVVPWEEASDAYFGRIPRSGKGKVVVNVMQHGWQE